MRRFLEVLTKAPTQENVDIVCPRGIVLVRDKATGKTLYSEPFDRQLAVHSELVLKRARLAQLKVRATVMQGAGKPSPSSRRG